LKLKTERLFIQKRKRGKMQIPKVEEIQNVIDTCFIAVDESKFGPIFCYPDPTNILQKQINQLAFGVFTNVCVTVLSNVLRDYEGKKDTTDSKKE
jgi:hypothetical protein